jgi:hypothetical protein
MAYSGKKTTASGPLGSYTVDELNCKAACRAFQNAIGGGGTGRQSSTTYILEGGCIKLRAKPERDFAYGLA